MIPVKCLIDTCERVAKHVGLCPAHYQRKQHGLEMSKPLVIRRPPHVVKLRDSAGRKYCITCKTWRDESQFQVDSKVSDGLRVWCKGCARFKKCLRQWGLTPAQYHEIWQAQGGICPICLKSLGVNMEGRGRGPAIDHDHRCCPRNSSCGKCIRGIIHVKCNSLLGLAEDSPEVLIRAADYLVSRRLPLDQAA